MTTNRSTVILFLTGLVLAVPACAPFQGLKPSSPAALSATGAAAQEKLPEAKPSQPPRVIDIPAQGPLRISLAEAGLIALENNRSLVVERFNPAILKTYEDQELSLFDPTLEAETYLGKSSEKKTSTSTGGIYSTDSTAFQARISLSRFFPSGAFLEVGIENGITDSDQYQDPFYSSRLGLTANQPLLRGKGSEVNLVQVRKARLDTAIEEYELRSFIEILLAEVENAYWDYALSRRRIEIVEESLRLARQQMNETEEMIHVGDHGRGGTGRGPGRGGLPEAGPYQRQVGPG